MYTLKRTQCGVLSSKSPPPWSRGITRHPCAQDCTEQVYFSDCPASCDGVAWSLLLSVRTSLTLSPARSAHHCFLTAIRKYEYCRGHKTNHNSGVEWSITVLFFYHHLLLSQQKEQKCAVLYYLICSIIMSSNYYYKRRRRTIIIIILLEVLVVVVDGKKMNKLKCNNNK